MTEASSPTRVVVDFPPFRFDPRTGQLFKNGRPVKLHPQPAKVLALLLERAGEVVPREELQKTVWGEETHVDFDLGLNSCIRQIRSVLGDDADEPRYVETVPRVGYRFVGHLQSVREETPEGKSPRRLALVSALAALVLVTGSLVWHFTGRTAESPDPVVLPATNLEGDESDPAISPDGKYLAFTWRRRDLEPGTIFVKLLPDGPPKLLARGQSPTWSPDGSRIAFLRRVGRQSDVFIVPMLGGEERRVGRVDVRREAGFVYDPGIAWSSAGTMLAVPDRIEGRVGIVEIDLATGEKRPLTVPSDEESRDALPAYSPDGSRLAFIRGWVGRELWIQPLPEGEAKLLYRHEGPLLDVEWTPEGDRLIFAATRQRRARLWSIAVAGGAPTPLEFGEVSFGGAGVITLQVSVSGTGKRLAYREGQYTGPNIYRAPGPKGPEASPEKLIASTGADFYAHYSPDGRRIAFVSNRDGTAAIWICSAAGESCRKVGEDSFGPSWSPDGLKIAYQSPWPSSEPGDIYVTELETHATRQLTLDIHDDILPTWSSDGEWIYFNSNHGGNRSIWKMRSDGSGSTVPVVQDGARVVRESAALESADGKWVYYAVSRPDAEYKFVDLWRMPVAGGDPEPVLVGRDFEGKNWTLWDDLIVYRHWVEGAPTWETFDPETGEERRWLQLPPGPRFHFGTSVSPDGQWLLYSRKDVDGGGDIVIVENWR